MESKNALSLHPGAAESSLWGKTSQVQSLKLELSRTQSCGWNHISEPLRLWYPITATESKERQILKKTLKILRTKKFACISSFESYILCRQLSFKLKKLNSAQYNHSRKTITAKKKKSKRKTHKNPELSCLLLVFK